MSRAAWSAFGNLGILVLGLLAEPGVPLVEPSELTRRADLLGQRVAVDDRVAFFQYHKDSDSFDEIRLKRTSVPFRLPPRLRFERSPQAAAVRVEGVLKREGDRWVCDVTALELLPPDLERLEQHVAALAPRDAEGRVAWARWARHRGQEFQDRALLERARLLEAEAIRIEAELETERPSADPPRHWLALARRARQREVPEPEPSALAHRAFSARLAKAESVAELQALFQEIADFWPESPRSRAGGAELDPWLAAYATDPAAAYRAAPEPVRAALDHRLWADATQRLFERKMAAEPGRALELAKEAAAALRDRPQVVQDLLERGLKEATRDLSALRQGDVEALGRVYREALHQPEAERDLLRRWLDEQRDHRLSATDAEGRVLLANQYLALLQDRTSAVELLRAAWQIDPQSREVADAFRRLGFRRLNDQWVESPRSRPDLVADADAESAPSPAPPTPRSTTLRGLTPQEVRVRLGGKPDRIVLSASQGQLVEQWIYVGVNQDQYVNFLHTPGDLLPKVVAYYARPHSRFEVARPR